MKEDVQKLIDYARSSDLCDDPMVVDLVDVLEVTTITLEGILDATPCGHCWGANFPVCRHPRSKHTDATDHRFVPAYDWISPFFDGRCRR